MARADDVDPAEPEDDDAAYHWAGDEARGQAGPAFATAASGTDVGDATVAAPDEPVKPTGRARLLGTGVFGGVFLVFTVGWILSVQAIPNGASDLFGEVMWQFGEFLAIISAALWFSATTYLTRETRTAVRFGWLVLGVVLLVPWPIILGFLA